MGILVTGGAGFIGSHLADSLVARGERVTVIDDLSTGDRRNLGDGVELLELDVRSAAAAAAIRERTPRAVLHLAAQMSVSRSVREPLFDADVNVAGSLNVIEAAADVGARVVFASTGGALYGDAESLPTPETAPAWPVSPYGVSKLAVEHYLHSYRFNRGLAYAALRLANVYGPRQNPHGEAGVVAIFCRNLLAGREAVINGDGRQTRDYVYVGDVVAAFMAALDSPDTGHFNVGTGLQTDVNRLFELLAPHLGATSQPVHGPARPGEQRTSALDAGLALERLGWEPRTSLEDGLAATAQWFRAAG